MNITVLYHSRNGHTRTLADNIADVIKEQGHTVTLKSVIEVSTHDVESADMLFIGTWVHGLILFNVRPADAEMWTRSLPALDGKLVATFCTYAFNPRKSLTILNDLLSERGATIIGSQAFHRGNIANGVEAFVSDTLASVAVTA